MYVCRIHFDSQELVQGYKTHFVKSSEWRDDNIVDKYCEPDKYRKVDLKGYIVSSDPSVKITVFSKKTP